MEQNNRDYAGSDYGAWSFSSAYFRMSLLVYWGHICHFVTVQKDTIVVPKEATS